MYETLLNIYLNYNLQQIYQDRINIRKILIKIYKDKLIIHYQKIDEFLYKIVFNLLNIYKNDEYLFLNIVSFLKNLNFRDLLSDQNIYKMINFHKEFKEIQEGVSTLIAFKQKAEEEDHTK